MIGSKIAGPIYQYRGDKTTLARDYLVTKLHVAESVVKAIPREKVLDTLTAQLHLKSGQETTRFLFDTYRPDRIWFVFAAIGIFSMAGMLAYNSIVEKKRVGPVAVQ